MGTTRTARGTVERLRAVVAGDDETRIPRERGTVMAGETIRADAAKIASAVSVFRSAGGQAAEVELGGVAGGVDSALTGGSATAAALHRACRAAQVTGSRSAERLHALADFAHGAHRDLEIEDSDFADLLGRVAPR